jgi:hypothetical protein
LLETAAVFDLPAAGSKSDQFWKFGSNKLQQHIALQVSGCMQLHPEP